MLRAPGRNADAVAEMTVALLFAVNRGVVPRRPRRPRGRGLRATARSPTSASGPGSWPGRPSGIVGLGAVGRATAWRLAGLGMKVIAYDPFAPDATHSLDDLLAEADVDLDARGGHARDRPA